MASTWFGWSDLHQETYTWNDYRVNPKSQWWEVTHWDGREYAVQRAESFEETAKLSGTSAEEVSRWHSGLQSLGVDMIARVRRTESGVPFSYIEIGYFPYLDPYGFRFVPPGDGAAERELESWTKRPASARHRMDALGNGWFYYEGR
jgi:hypothetical protein